MPLKITLTSIVFFTLTSSIEINKYSLELPDYDFHRNIHVEVPLRERFLIKKNKNIESRKKLKLLDNLPDQAIYLDGIVHYEVNNDQANKDKVDAMELGLRKIFAAEGLSYSYKRDHYWRTWRKVSYPKGDKVICYKYNNVVNISCEICREYGYWSIVNNVPCPFEFFSMINTQQMCGADFTKPYDYKDNCPYVVNFTEFATACDNPMKTVYRIKKMFKASNIIPPYSVCGNQDYCEISTIYRIYEDFILLRVVNKTNDIIYSRIMKYGKKNYACISKCGRVDAETHNVKNDKPLSINLLPTHINKRENENEIDDNTILKIKKGMEKKAPSSKIKSRKKLSRIKYRFKIKHALKHMEKALNKFKNDLSSSSSKSVTMTSCTKLSKQYTMTEDYEDMYDYDHNF